MNLYKNYKNIKISSKGELLTISNEPVRTWVKPNGYICAVLPDTKEIITVHRLVAKLFIPNPLNLSQVNHKDCNKANNDYMNLEWCDRLANMKHAKTHGLIVKGEDCVHAKLTTNIINEIRRLHIKGDIVFGAVGLSKKYNTSESNIRKIIKRLTWDC